LGGETASRSPESILRVIRAHIGGIQYTFQKHLRRDSTLGGKISLKFTIAPSGDIIAITVVASNTGSTILDQEILDKARRMKFDTVERGNTTVTYQFVLDRLSGNP
jgi:TonB family protein